VLFDGSACESSDLKNFDHVNTMIELDEAAQGLNKTCEAAEGLCKILIGCLIGLPCSLEQFLLQALNLDLQLVGFFSILEHWKAASIA
jgi:hypothetical protein